MYFKWLLIEHFNRKRVNKWVTWYETQQTPFRGPCLQHYYLVSTLLTLMLLRDSLSSIRRRRCSMPHTFTHNNCMYLYQNQTLYSWFKNVEWLIFWYAVNLWYQVYFLLLLHIWSGFFDLVYIICFLIIFHCFDMIGNSKMVELLFMFVVKFVSVVIK